MKYRQIIYASAMIVLGFIQSAPAFFMLASTIIPVVVLGLLWLLLLGKFWTSTRIGRWLFREMWRSTLRLESFMRPPLGKC